MCLQVQVSLHDSLAERINHWFFCVFGEMPKMGTTFSSRRLLCFYFLCSIVIFGHFGLGMRRSNFIWGPKISHLAEKVEMFMTEYCTFVAMSLFQKLCSMLLFYDVISKPC